MRRGTAGRPASLLDVRRGDRAPTSSSPTPTRSGPTSSWSTSSELPAEYRRAIEHIKIESPVMKINLAVRELPKFTGAARATTSAQGSTGGLFIAPSDRLHAARLRRRAQAGEPADEALHEHPHAVGGRPTRSRRTGMHTISIFTQYFPYDAGRGHLGRAPRRDRQERDQRRSPSTRRTSRTRSSACRCWRRPISRRASA